MAATGVLDEYNGVGETETPDVNHCNFGSDDSANLVVATYPITVNTNSFEKWWKMTFLGTFNSVDNLKVWKVSGVYFTEETIDTNARETSYGGAETYVQPTQTTSTVATEVLPTTEPSGANLGIGGTLGGSLGAPGDSDYLVMQLQTTSNTEVGDGNQKVFRFQWDES